MKKASHFSKRMTKQLKKKRFLVESNPSPEDFQNDILPISLPTIDVLPSKKISTNDLTKELQRKAKIEQNKMRISAHTLLKYITTLEKVQNLLTGLSTKSLQKVVHALDREGTVFEGITKCEGDILRAVTAIDALLETLKHYVIVASKSIK